MSNMTIAQFAAVLKHNEQMLIARMTHDGILQPSNGRPNQVHVRRNYFAVGQLVGGAALLTGKGQVWLVRKYPAGCELGVVA